MLHHYLEDALKLYDEGVYLKTSVETFSYRQVYEKCLFFEKLLKDHGLEKGDRILIYSSKNVASIVLMMACSMCEAVYVPVSSANPAVRAIYIAKETTPRFIFCDEPCRKAIIEAGLTLSLLGFEDGISMFSYVANTKSSAVSTEAAFILFTSGSTGTPKGVVISHSAARSFIDWAAQEFSIKDQDVLASIAPFNFDLSVFDIYVSASRGASLVLYSEDETKNAMLMGQKISFDKVTTIYATPTFYSTLALYGKLHKYDYASLKKILFAGEVFQLEVFYKLLEYWPDKIFANLYGPTETNVCTFYKVDSKRIDYPVFPIGKACDFAKLLLIDEQGREIEAKHVQGELLVSGDSLFTEYWNDPIKTTIATQVFKDGRKYYRTGDIVYKNENDNYVYVARNDRMIKKNGYRIEPLEVESAMLNYQGVTNTAVCYSKEKNQLVCFLESPESSNLDIAELKEFCQRKLPAYMIPDKFVLLQTMPMTSSGKVDLQVLNNEL